MAFSGRLDFDPSKDSLLRPDGSAFHFASPEGLELPEKGFANAAECYVRPSEDGTNLKVPTFTHYYNIRYY